MTHATPDTGPQTLTLQPGLLACYTSAREIGATGAGRTFEGNDQFIHFNCQLTGMFQGQIGRQWVELAAGDLSCGHAAGERFHVRHCAKLHNIEVMLTPQVLSELAGSGAFERLCGQREMGMFIRNIRANRPALRAAGALARMVTRAPEQRLRQHNVTETAGLLGYSNISHFSAAFCR